MTTIDLRMMLAQEIQNIPDSDQMFCTKDGKADAGQNVKFSAASALKTLRALA